MAVLLLANTASVFASKEETLEDLINRIPSAKPEDRPKLYVEVARRQLKSADQLYTEGKAEEARTAVSDVVGYSEKATQAVLEQKRKFKDVEIAVRKMADRLRDIKRTLNFEDQPPVQQAVDHLEALRTQLLSAMFGGKEPK
jgi:polyhydroxyalkanoate synthesis regulator phasin